MDVEEKTHVRRPVAPPAPPPAAGSGEIGSPAIEHGGAPAVTGTSPLSERFLAWADRHRRKLTAAVVLLYLVAFNGRWRLDADSALYLTIGRNLAEGRGFTYHGRPHTLAYPGMPWLFAG